MKLLTDDYSTIERLAHQGKIKSEGIAWLKSILNWKWYYWATLKEDAL